MWEKGVENKKKMVLRRIIYLPPLLLSNEPFAVHYRQSILMHPLHVDVEVVFRERRPEQDHQPLAFPLRLPVSQTFIRL